MKFLSALFCFLLPLSAAANQKAVQFFGQGDLASAFETLCRSAEQAPSDPRTAVSLGQVSDFLDLVPSFDRLTNACKTVMTSSSDAFLRYTAADILCRHLLRRGKLASAAALLDRLSFVTQWQALGVFKALGRPDLDTAFLRSETNLIPSPRSGIVPQALEVSAFSVEGAVRPFSRFDGSGGVVYCESYVLLPSDGNYFLHVVSDAAYRLSVNDVPAAVRDPPAGDGRNCYVKLGLRKGWQKIAIKLLSAGNDPEIRVSLLDSNWQRPAHLGVSRTPAAYTRSAEISEYVPPQSALFEAKTRAFAMKPDDHFLQALVFEQDGRQNAFYRSLSKALDGDKKNAAFKLYFSASVLNDGNEHANSGRVEKAVRFLKELAASGTPAAWDLLARYYSRQKRVSEAGEAFQKAWTSNSNSPLFLSHRMEFFFDEGWIPEFLRTAEQCLAAIPFSSRVNAYLAGYYTAQPLSAATNYYGRIESAWPCDISMLDYARFCAASGAGEKASRIASRLENYYPGWAAPAVFQADLLSRSGDRNAAVRAYTALAKRFPFSPDVITAAGRALLRFGDPTGLGLMKQGLSLRPADLSLADEISQLEKDRPWSLGEYLDRDSTQRILAEFRASTTNDRSVPAAVLQDEEVLQVNPDATCIRLVHQIVRLNDKQGIEDWGSPSIDANRSTRIVKAVTHLKDGSSIDVTTIQRQGGNLVLSFPGLEQGCLIELTYCQALFSGRVSSSAFFHSDPSPLRLADVPVGRMAHTILLPAGGGHRLNRRNFGTDPGLSVTERTEAGRRVIRIVTTNIEALRSEPMMPPLTDLVASFNVTDFPSDPQNCRNWYAGLWKPSIQQSAELNDLLMKLSANPGVTNRGMNLVRAVYAWIAGNIATEGYDLYDPTPLRRVVDGRSGTAEQKARLMGYFLDRLGIPYRLLLARTADAPQENVTNLAPSFFNCPVIQVTGPGGRGDAAFLDFDSRYFPFGTLGWDKFGAMAMDTATAALERLPPAGPESGRMFYSNLIVVRSNEDPVILGVRRYEGCFAVYQELFDDVSTRELSVNQMENRDLRNVSVTNTVFSESGIAGYTFGGRLADVLVARESETEVPVVCRKARLGESFIGRSERSLPLKIGQPFFFSQRLVYRFDPGTADRISVPPDHSVTNAFGRYTSTFVKGKDSTVEAVIELRVEPQTVLPGDYAKFAEFCAGVDGWEKEVIVLKK